MANDLAIILGVGPGLGQALARRFASGGMDVAMIARDESRLSDLGSAISDESGQTVRAFTGDGTRFDSLNAAMTRIAGEMGPASVFIHNVSRWIPAKAPSLDPAELVAEMTLGAGAALAATQAVLPAMETAGRGTVLWTGSAMGLKPAEAGAASPALTAGKAALRGLALAAAKSFHDRGINFATITINGTIGNAGFEPDTIAEAFWAAHVAPKSEWRGEHIFDGAD